MENDIERLKCIYRRWVINIVFSGEKEPSALNYMKEEEFITEEEWDYMTTNFLITDIKIKDCNDGNTT
jgi:hypothetical protein